VNNDEITAEVAARHNIYAIVDLIEISCILNRVNSSVVVRLTSLLAVAQAKNLTYSGRPRPSYVAAKAEMKITPAATDLPQSRDSLLVARNM